MDGAAAGDDTIARNLLGTHAELDASVLLEHVQLYEAILIEQQIDALARGQLAALMLLLDTIHTAAEQGSTAELMQTLGKRLGHRRLLGRGLGCCTGIRSHMLQCQRHTST